MVNIVNKSRPAASAFAPFPPKASLPSDRKRALDMPLDHAIAGFLRLSSAPQKESVKPHPARREAGSRSSGLPGIVVRLSY